MLIGVLTLIVLAIHPIPECVDCEFPNLWGRNDAVYLRDSFISGCSASTIPEYTGLA